MCRDRIQALPCWEQVLSIEPLNGGITNRNFLVREPSRQRVVRMLSDGSCLGIDRRNERACQSAACQAGVSPALVHADAEILVTEFVVGEVLQSDALHRGTSRQRMADLLQQLHASGRVIAGQLLYFCPFQTIRMYVDTARQLGAVLPSDIDTLVQNVQQLADRMQPFQPTLCHNDLLPANVVDDGKRLWLIDWEYAGIGNPLFDVAGVAANFQLTREETEDLLRCYLGRSPGTAGQDVRILLAASLLREALWAVIQTRASSLEFDFAGYAAKHLDAFRETVSEFAETSP
ncbi:MAG: choline/ethanolamine kinase family protein [Planctomycetaceae bacterium]